ncbi:MAG: carbamoyltransferase HypF [Myxococcota bacterium]
MGERLRFSGTVQGVGFRPTAARVARRLGLRGRVHNDGEGVTVTLAEGGDGFLEALMAELPPLADVRAVRRAPVPADALGDVEGFVIDASAGGSPRAAVAPDAGMCPQCRAEVRDPFARRYRYPFASCTHCGPRFSVVTAIPYDRENTTLAEFPLCEACHGEFEDESARHFHAQTTACHVCGPTARLERGDGRPFPPSSYSMMDEVDAVCSLLMKGEIVAIKGIGGYHLCCDATNDDAVARLRERKRRPHKPFALMARDLDVIREHARVDAAAEAALTSIAAPIVLCPREPETDATRVVAEAVAPGQRTLGFMLPTAPLHELMLIRMDRPIVCTSGNVSEEPQVTDDDDARERLGGRGGRFPAIADWLLTHNRPIANRVDDSVVRVIGGETRILRRARGYAPRALPLPPGLEGAPPILALGAELKASVALGGAEEVVLSQHLGDLADLRAFAAWQDALDLLTRLWEHTPRVLAVDLHPGYRASEVGRGLAQARQLPLVGVQHHHAHLAAVLAEHDVPASTEPCLGIALDGLGMGDDGLLWGGELMAFGYARYERLATFRPVAMLGGDKASREPWRNLYAHLRAHFSLGELRRDYGDLPLLDALAARPTKLLDGMLASGTNAPLASSCGRLFDAVAAALGLFPDGISYEAQAAMALENEVTPAALAQARAEADRGDVYPVAMPTLPEGGPAEGLPYLEWRGVWGAILGDLAADTPRPLIAARFHVALAEALRAAAERLHRGRESREEPLARTVALSGGCFQNATLLEETERRLSADGWRVLSPRLVPPNDGGIAYGQAVVAAARLGAGAAPRGMEQ